MQTVTQGFRISDQQKELWLQQQAMGPEAFRAVFHISIEGAIQPELLQKAIDKVVDRHEILRTTFQRPTGIKTPYQVVSESANSAMDLDDLSHLTVAAEEQLAIDAQWKKELTREFNFKDGPVIRTSLLKLSGDRHALLGSLPTLCCDALTIANLVTEIRDAYVACLTGQELHDVPLQYADFAEWQRELHESDDEQSLEGKRFWQRVKTDFKPVSVFLLENRRVAPHAFRPENVSFDFPPNVISSLEALARKHETSLRTLLFACWQTLVCRLTNQRDFAIFNLCEGRQLEDLGNAFGPYAKYLPVLCHCEDVSFSTQLRSTTAALREAEMWQEYFDSREFSDAARNSIAFDFVEYPQLTDARRPSFKLIKHYVCSSPFKIKLSCVLNGSSLKGELFYDTKLLDRETVERCVKYFQHFVAGVSCTDYTKTDRSVQSSSELARPAVKVTTGAVEILDTDERGRLLHDLNNTTTKYSANRCIHQLFEAQVERTPTAPALICGDDSLTYSELNERSNQIANLLLLSGLSGNARVGLCMARSAEAIVAMMGILKAGGAYVPLNPDHPPARLALQLSESKASFLLTNAGISDVVEFSGKTIDLQHDRELLTATSNRNPLSVADADDLVYVIYTSGSTGTPKGVGVRHQGLVNYSEFILQRLQVKAPLSFATVSTITADLGNTCIFPALVSGGCLHIISYEVAVDGELFARYNAKRPLDVLKIVPSHLSALLDTNPDGEILPSQYLILGGEALSWELVERIKKAGPTCAIINHYGPTETTVGSLTFSVASDTVGSYSATVPIGQPIANACAYVLDDYLKPVPIGVPGELYIGGVGLAAGYLNRPEETAARFVPDPFSGESGGRMYSTGDRARWLTNGNVEFLGRVDHQVKLRGFRVELGEIEAVLASHKDVDQAVVAIDSRENNQRLIGYVTGVGAEPPTNDELRSFLLESLPDYMIPSAFVFLKSFPLTPNGKIDRLALAAAGEAQFNPKQPVAPRTTIEKELTEIWAEFLKLKVVGVHDNFFEIGGHSLLATQVVSRMRQVFGSEILLRTLFEAPTVAQLAAQIERASLSEAERLLVEIDQLSDDEVDLLLKSEETGS